MREFLTLKVFVILMLVVGSMSATRATAKELSFPGKLEQQDEKFDETGEFFDIYEIQLEAGEFVDLYVASEDFDTYLLIIEPDETEINIDDYYTDDLNAGILFVARQAGKYTVYVTSSEVGETGAYEFTCDSFQTSLIQAQEGVLDKDDEVSWKGGEYFDTFELKLEPNEKRVLTLQSEDFSVYLAMHWPNGYVDYVFGYPAATTIEADEDGGTYTLIVTSTDARQVGDYRLEIRSIDEPENAQE